MALLLEVLGTVVVDLLLFVLRVALLLLRLLSIP